MKPPRLETLYVYLTEGCNLACRHCWLSPPHDPDGRRHRSLPVETFAGLLSEGPPLGLRTLKLTGGEPLLHPEIGAILDLARDSGLSLWIETNGVLLTPALAERIALCRQPLASVSLDGAVAATHDGIRGIEGAFESACRGLAALADAGVESQVIMSLMASNAEEIGEVIALAERFGAASVKFNIAQPTGRGEGVHRRREALAVDELIGIGRRVEEELAPSTDLRLFFDLPPAFRSLGRLASGEDDSLCGILGILGVLPGGEYALCGIGSRVRELVFGVCGRDSLEKVWSSHPVLTELRQGLPDRLGGVCGRCLMRHRCLGSCIAQNYYQSKSLLAPFWFCREAEEQGLFPPSRLAT